MIDLIGYQVGWLIGLLDSCLAWLKQIVVLLGWWLGCSVDYIVWDACWKTAMF